MSDILSEETEIDGTVFQALFCAMSKVSWEHYANDLEVKLNQALRDVENRYVSFSEAEMFLTFRSFKRAINSSAFLHSVIMWKNKPILVINVYHDHYSIERTK